MQFAHSKAVALPRVGECMIYKLQNYNCQPLSITLLSKAIARKANHAILLIHTHSIGPSIRISTEVVIPNVTKSVFVRRLF